MNRKGLSLLEVLAVIAILAILAIFFLPHGSSRESARRSACVNNLKQLGLVLNMYANENEGRYPPIDNVTNNFIFESDVLYPEYLSDAQIVACPSDPETDYNKNFRLVRDHKTDWAMAGQVHPDCITNMSYSYLGWMLMTDAETAAFFEEYDKMSLEDRDNDLIVPEGSGNLEGTVIHRISKDVGRFLIEDVNAINADGQDANSVIPIIWDQISTDISEFSHVPAGQNVLYLDGHVDFHRYDMAGQDAQYLDGKVEFRRPGGVVADFPISPISAAQFGGRTRDPIPDCEE